MIEFRDIISIKNQIIIDGKNGIEFFNSYGFLDFFTLKKYFINCSIPKYTKPTTELKIINRHIR